MANFRYSDDNVTWSDVPDYAHPDDRGSVRIVYPRPRGMNLLMAPAQVVGPKRFLLMSPQMQGTGWNWWTGFFANDPTRESFTVYLQVYNERRPTGGYNNGPWHKVLVRVFRPQGQVVSHGVSPATMVWGSVRVDGVVLSELD